VLPLFVCGWLVFGLQSGAQTVFVGLGMARRSLFLAVLRKVILLIPLALILPQFLGAVGVFAAEPISDTISGLTAGAMYLSVRKKYLTGGQMAGGKVQDDASSDRASSGIAASADSDVNAA
jgi:Na+-driven multidrug efflux pump